jgi:putative transposase
MQESGTVNAALSNRRQSVVAVATVILSHKIALAPTKKQEEYFRQACGVARFTYNWALAEWERQYKAGLKPNECQLRRELNAIKSDQFPWMADVTKCAVQQGVKNLGIAYKNYFRDLKKTSKRKAQRPMFKRKGQHDSFRAENGPETFECRGKRIKLPRIGWIKMREELMFKGKPLSVTVSRVADRWFASVNVEIEHEVPKNHGGVVGVDLGVKTLATCSDGRTFDGPRALRKNLKKLQRLSRSHSRKVKGSANRRKAQMKLARMHARISNIRKDALHKMTTELTKSSSVIGIESLNVRGMMKNRKLARAIADIGMYEASRQFDYKAALYGCQIFEADRWFPSSKTCHVCEHVLDELNLSVRQWDCPKCGTTHDRDGNASMNLKNLAASYAVTACGIGSAGNSLRDIAKLPMMNQEQEEVSV